MSPETRTYGCESSRGTPDEHVTSVLLHSSVAAASSSASAARMRSATEYSALARTRSTSNCPHDASGSSAHALRSSLETVAVHSDRSADDGESGRYSAASSHVRLGETPVSANDSRNFIGILSVQFVENDADKIDGDGGAPSSSLSATVEPVASTVVAFGAASCSHTPKPVEFPSTTENLQ